MTYNDAMKHLVSRYTGKYEGKWGIVTPTILTPEDFEAWECLRAHVDVIKEVDAKFAHIDETDDDDGIIGMI
jgi:hypothetical protein